MRCGLHGFHGRRDGGAAALALALALSSCVEAASDDAHGTVHFAAGAAITNTDYDPMAAPGATGPASTAGTASTPPPGGAAGTSGPTMPPVAGTMAGPDTGTAGASGVGAFAGSGGVGAAGTGTTGAAGTAAAGSGAAGTAAGEGGTAPASGGTLTIEFTSVNQGGRYSPRNVGAVWIENGAGKFVKTIERWAGIRANHLTHWGSVSGGWPTALFGGGGMTADQMDAVSRATLRSHEKHMLTWSMKDVDGTVVPDGMYKVGIEVTEDNFVPGAWKVVEFQKGAQAQTVMAPDAPPFSGLKITYQP